MDTLRLVLPVVIAVGIANVWLVRRSRPSAYRGGHAQSMQEEFAVYGLSARFMLLIGALKLALAALLLVGIWVPALAAAAAGAMALLMLGAVAMHVKVGDPLRRALPALGMLAMCVGVVLLYVPAARA